uniref:Uncharacterized protein n=1 Tax=viral metagenome TaxID=1070528 RepID=A0A6M3LS37_9ZZZZ
MSFVTFTENKKKQPDKIVKCGFCGAGINLRRDYGHYIKNWDGRYKCEDCHYRPGYQY